MHELAIAENIIEVVQEQLRASGKDGRVTQINVRVGRLTGVEPGALQFCFAALIRGSPLAEAALTIESVPVTGECKSCRQGFQLDEVEFTCPHCGSFAIELRTGRELLVDSFEVEEGT